MKEDWEIFIKRRKRRLQRKIFLFFFGLLVLIIGIMISFKPILIDPIENIKKNHLNMQFYIIIFAIVVLLINLYSRYNKKSGNLIKILSVIILVMTVFSIISKINMDNRYTQEFFEKLYNGEYETDEKLNMINLNDISKMDRGIFVEENLRAYKYFSKISFIVFCLHIGIILCNWYVLIKVDKEKKQLEKLKQDDIILEDNEQDVI